MNIDTYCPILFTIRFSIFFKEFAINPFFTNATFKAFFMVHFTKGRAAFHTNGLLTYSTFSWKVEMILKVDHYRQKLAQNIFRFFKPYQLSIL